MQTSGESKNLTAAPVKPASGKKLWLFLVVTLAVAGVVLAVQNRRGETDAKKGPAAGRMALPPVPVIAGKVTQRDVPIYLDGIGTAQAFNTVTVHARVDGQLMKVAFTEGQDVRAGDVLALIDPAPFRTALEQSVAKKGEDEAQLANAKITLKRNEQLLAEKILAQQDYDTQKALVDQFEAAVKADQAAIDSAKVQLNYTTITSPIDGRTGIRLVDAGNIVHANDANGLVLLTQLRPISVVFTLPEQTLAQIRQNTGAEGVTILAMDRDNTTVLEQGKLAVIDNQIDITTSTIKLKATFTNEHLRLWPGQFVNARLLLTVRKGSTVVPASVVQRGPEGAFAFVIKEDQTVDIRPVKVAQIEQGEALIDEGLRPGEMVVVDGQYRLQRGSTVKTADAPGAGDERGGRGAKPGGAAGEKGGPAQKKAKP